MSKKANPAIIGGFVIGAAVLTLGGILAFGSGQFFAPKLPLVMYFRESVRGLDVGSPIIFKGVTIGTITDIDLRVDLRDETLSIPVFGEFEPGSVTFVGDTAREFGEIRELEAGKGTLGKSLIQRGMRAQLTLTSFVTGKLAVSMVMRPESAIRLVEAGPDFRTPDDRLEIPTVPSELATLKETIEKVVNKISELKLDKMIEDTQSVIKSANKLLSDPELVEIIHEAKFALKDARQLIQNVDSQVVQVATDLKNATNSFQGAADAAKVTLSDARKTLRFADTALVNASSFLSTAKQAINPDSPAYAGLTRTLHEVSAAARSIRSLSSALERDPDSLLFGRTKN